MTVRRGWETGDVAGTAPGKGCSEEYAEDPTVAEKVCSASGFISDICSQGSEKKVTADFFFVGRERRLGVTA